MLPPLHRAASASADFSLIFASLARCFSPVFGFRVARLRSLLSFATNSTRRFFASGFVWSSCAQSGAKKTVTRMPAKASPIFPAITAFRPSRFQRTLGRGRPSRIVCQARTHPWVCCQFPVKVLLILRRLSQSGTTLERTQGTGGSELRNPANRRSLSKLRDRQISTAPGLK